MPFTPPGALLPNPSLIDQLADGMSLLYEARGIAVRPDQIEVLRQQTFEIGAHPLAGSEVQAVSGCFVLAHDVPSADGKALGLFLAARRDSSSPWQVTMQQATGLPYPAPQPFFMLSVLAPLLCWATAVHIFGAPVATLSAELPDGTVIADHAINRSLLLMLPVHAPHGWTEAEAPLLTIKDDRDIDVIPPSRRPFLLWGDQPRPST